MITRLGLALLWLLYRLLGARALGRLGAALGGLLYHLPNRRRRIGATNLRLCFPDKTAVERAALLKAHYRAFFRATLQEAVSWWGTQQQVETLTRIEDFEHIAPHLGKPLIILAPHFVGLNLAAVRLSIVHSPTVSIYARIKNPAIAKLIQHARSRFGPIELYDKRVGVKPVLRAIKRGLPFYYLPDLDHGRRDAVFAPFFGVPAATLTGLSRIAALTGAVVVPCIAEQTADGYVARFYPAWTDFPSGDVEADVRRMNAFIEDRVRELPEQYFWLHQRFKTRPEGEARLYD